MRAVDVGIGEEASYEEGESGEGGEVVVLLAGGEGEEAEDDAGPEEAGEGGFAAAVDEWRFVETHISEAGCGAPRCCGPTLAPKSGREDGAPGSCAREKLASESKRRARMASRRAAGRKATQGKSQRRSRSPEDGDGDLAVVVGDAMAEEAGDVLVVEIEPGPAGVGGEA